MILLYTLIAMSFIFSWMWIDVVVMIELPSKGILFTVFQV